MADLLASGSQRRPHRGLRVAVAAVVALALLAVLADRWQRGREVDALVARAAAGQQAVRYADGRVRAAQQYAAPALGGAGVPAGVRTSLEQVVRGAAGDRVADLRDQRAATAGVAVLPWHAQQRRARQAYVGYLDLRAAYLAGIAADLDVLYEPHPELLAALERARSAYLAAAGARGGGVLPVPVS